MLARLKLILLATALGGAALAASGCCAGENKAATSKCAHSGKNADSCKSCCKSVTGKDSYTYSPSGCKCYLERLTMLKKIVLSLSLAGALLAVSGCCGGSKQNAAATNYCRLNKSDESCKSCCTSQRAKSSTFVGGSCQCYQLAPTPAAPRRTRADGAITVAMATCKSCGEDVETLVSVKVGGKAKKICEDCADRAREEAAVAEESEAVVQQMMGFKGRR